jgi:hypothetical protein
MKNLLLDDTLIDCLRRVIERDIERQEAHITWLAANPNAADRDVQLRDIQRLIAANTRLLMLLGVS